MRLCFSTVYNGNFTIIDESTREILKTVSLNLNLGNYKHIICSTCSVKLYSAFDFKCSCLYVEDKIGSYVNPKMPFVDLREVYLKEQENKAMIKIEADQKICRLCLQLVSQGFVSFHEEKLKIVHRYIPEVNFGCTEDPLICRQCFNSLSLHDTFIKTCLDVETQIHSIGGNKIASDTFIKSEENEVKLEDEQMDGIVKIKKESEADKMLIKTEEIDIKFEGEEWKSDSCSSNLRNEIIENKIKLTYEEAVKINNEYLHICESGLQISKCDAPLDVSSHNSGYKTELKSGLKQGTVNEDPLDIKMYKCDACTYEAKYRRLLRVHQLVHKDPSEIKLYKCESCTYETKYKSDLKGHQLIHKDPSEITMYKCDACTFTTKFKRHLKKHQLIHKDISEIQMYKCDTCAYETRYKRYLKVHQLSHKDPSEIKMYKCDSCPYETKYRCHLKAHQLAHKDPSEIKMYKCDSCTYETKNRSHLKSHQRSHKDSSEIQMYKCELCIFETKYKNHLKRHQLSHKDPSEIQMYKCDVCPYETKYKSHVNKHRVIHKNVSEIQMYKCYTCTYETRYKKNLNHHQSTHRK
ncbi:zinc finger protein 112-like isoform X2 [Anoplophora glabripennis]|uniref:zinc finger protein 112-like isoform X2 n=1 Tax=Anoplophora glabripennis TaxID=217634 RepID=UPI000C75E0DC|nr:zinc finger protein 112-like isoform X2 [Anoplophora glabripennis]